MATVQQNMQGTCANTKVSLSCLNHKSRCFAQTLTVNAVFCRLEVVRCYCTLVNQYNPFHAGGWGAIVLGPLTRVARSLHKPSWAGRTLSLC